MARKKASNVYPPRTTHKKAATNNMLCSFNCNFFRVRRQNGTNCNWLRITYRWAYKHFSKHASVLKLLIFHCCLIQMLLWSIYQASDSFERSYSSVCFFQKHLRRNKKIFFLPAYATVFWLDRGGVTLNILFWHYY